MHAAQRGGELVLFAARDPRLLRFEVPGVLGSLPRLESLLPCRRQHGDQRDVQGPRRAEPRAGRGIRPRGEGVAAGHRKHPQGGLVETQAAVEYQATGVGALELLSQILGDEADQVAAERQLRVRLEADGGVHDDAALARGKRWHVRPPAGQVETHRRGGVIRRRQLAASHGDVHQSCSVTSSPRTSMVTPCTRRFMPLTPRA